MEEFRNKVIARDYVEKNYIKKSELKEFIDGELEMIEENQYKGGDKRLILDGVEAAYRCILATFIKE